MLRDSYRNEHFRGCACSLHMHAKDHLSSMPERRLCRLQPHYTVPRIYAMPAAATPASTSRRGSGVKRGDSTSSEKIHDDTAKLMNVQAETVRDNTASTDFTPQKLHARAVLKTGGSKAATLRLPQSSSTDGEMFGGAPLETPRRGKVRGKAPHTVFVIIS